MRSILKLEYTPISVTGGVRRAVGGYLRYLQYRDQRVEPNRDGGLDGYVRYLEHRDRTSPKGRVFGADETRTADRKKLVEYIQRSTQGLAPNWVRRRDGKLEDRQRAAYSLVISPDDWRGLDLRKVARACMTQLELDAGGLGPWFAAEHRNTAYHHVQIVLAARREVDPNRFRTVLITRARLQRMKDAIGREIALQRGSEVELGGAPTKHVGLGMEPDGAPSEPLRSNSNTKPPNQSHPTYRWRRARRGTGKAQSRTGVRRAPIASATLWRLQAVAYRYQHQMERELNEQAARSEREGWQR